MNPQGILVVDKPRGLTSHDVVGRVRRLLRTRRVGHAGTLDPAAEGVVVIAVGSATRLLQYIQETDKQYVAHVVLGVESVSGDIEGPLLAQAASQAPPTRRQIRAALDGLTGTIEQIPPAHSAIKVGGQPLYRRAHRGETVDVPPRIVTVHRIELLAYTYPDVILRIDCDTGVYVRAIARDLGAALGIGGYLHALLRTQVGRFGLAAAWSLGELDAGLRPETWPLFGLHPEAAVGDSPALILGRDATTAWYHGRPVPAGDGAPPATVARVYDASGRWLGIARAERADGHWQPRHVVGRAG